MVLRELDSFFAAAYAGNEPAIILLASIYVAIVGLVSLAVGLRIRSESAAQRSDEQDYEAAVRYRYNVDGEA